MSFESNLELSFEAKTSSMEVSAGLVAGSHNRDEIVVIRRDGEFTVSFFHLCKCYEYDYGYLIMLIYGHQAKSMQQQSGHI